VQEAPDPRNGFEQWELELIENVVRDFLATRPLSLLEFDDLRQEALAHWWQQRGRYDAERATSRRTFLRRVVNAKLVDVEREAKAVKRGGGQSPLSLDSPLSDDAGRTLGDTLEDIHQAEALAAAIDRARRRLSGRQQRVLREYQDAATKSEAARRAGISRDTFYEELALIRNIFRDEGLDEFLC
jgi:RNA polymerase sigma factor (sigma-70 family)